jgi:hypothetical protein
LANRVTLQAIKTEFSTQILSWRQRKCNKDTDLLRFDSKFTDDHRTKTSKEEVVVLKFGQFLQNTFVQLHTSVPFFGKSRKRLAENGK